MTERGPNKSVPVFGQRECPVRGNVPWAPGTTFRGAWMHGQDKKGHALELTGLAWYWIMFCPYRFMDGK